MAQLLTPTLVDLSTDTVCQFSFAYDTRAYAYYIYVDGVALNVLQWTATESEGFYTVTILESVFTEEKEYAITAQAYVLDGSYEDSDISDPIIFTYGEVLPDTTGYESHYRVTSASLVATANAIRKKTGSIAKIQWEENGFADAVEEIAGADEKTNSLCIVGTVPEKEYLEMAMAEFSQPLIGTVPQKSYSYKAITEYTQPIVGEFEVTT